MQNKFLALLLLTSIMCSTAFAQTADKPVSDIPVVAQPEASAVPLPTIALSQLEAVAPSTASVDKPALPEVKTTQNKPEHPKNDKKVGDKKNSDHAKKPITNPLPKIDLSQLEAVAPSTASADKPALLEVKTTQNKPKHPQNDKKVGDKKNSDHAKKPITNPLPKSETLPQKDKADLKPIQPPVKPVAEAKPQGTESKPADTLKQQGPSDKRAPFPGLKKPEGNQPLPNPQQEAVKPQHPAPASLESIQAENKRRLEEELKTTTLTGKDIVNFPNRSSLGSLELTTLPGINESMTNGPLPMAQSVSNKDLPSEQLLGRISPEVFQEMADIERGNTFLKLQMEKEKLKTDLEKLKATYRQQRLDEISKREDVVRTRIKWWQEQEKIRLEIEKKKLEEEALEREIAEQKEKREQLRAEAAARQAAASGQKPDKDASNPKIEVIIPTLEEAYMIESIRGLSGDLTATVKDRSTGAVFKIKRGDTLGSYFIREVRKDKIIGVYGKRTDQLVFQATSD